MKPPCFRRAAPLALLAATSLLIAGCSALPLAPARMALAAPLEAAPPLRFEGLSAGRQGRFSLDGQPVQFKRMGDALSLFDALRLDRVALQFIHDVEGTPGATKGRCDGRASTATAGVLDAAIQPLKLACSFSGGVDGELTLREQRLAAAGTRSAREGQARVGGQVFEIRSEHALQGTPLPLAQAAGYRILLGGRDIAALELTAGTPALRRVEGLDEATRRAVTQVALALGLWFDPAVTAQ